MQNALIEISNKAKLIITHPIACWLPLRKEQGGLKELFVPYVLVLSALPLIAQFIGIQLFGITIGMVTIRFPLGYHLESVISAYLFSLVSILILAFILKTLALKFKGNGDFISATRLVSYSLTPCWIAGILMILPSLTKVSAALSLYGFYVFYQGIDAMVGVREEKKPVFVGVFFITAIITMLIFWKFRSLIFTPTFMM